MNKSYLSIVHGLFAIGRDLTLGGTHTKLVCSRATSLDANSSIAEVLDTERDFVLFPTTAVNRVMAVVDMDWFE